MKRRPIIAGNWKMHKTNQEAESFIEAFLPLIGEVQCDILIAPPFTALSLCAQKAKNSLLKIGGQNMSHELQGALTGDISAHMLKSAGAQFVLLGHSERRTHFHETDGLIHQKLKLALAENLPAILCIGETQEERDSGESFEVLKRQLDSGIGDLTVQQLKALVVAYEPVWAIGTGITATKELAQECHALIRSHIAKTLGLEFAETLRILYGGSVKPDNIASLLEQEDIDGALIGGASLDVEKFNQMVQR